MSTENRQDANESLFFARDLEYQEKRIYEQEYPAIKFRQLFPVNNEGGRGVLFISYKMVDKAGLAQILADSADDPPRVNLSAKEFTARVYPVADSAEYTQFELDAAQAHALSLDSTLLETARMAYERKLDEIADSGNAATGLIGYNSHPNIPIVAPTTSAGAGDDTWPNKTATEIMADFSLLFTTIVANSKEVHAPTAVVMSSARMALLRQITLPNTGVFLLNALQQAYPGMAFLEWARMSTASAAGAQRMSMFVRDPAVLEFREPAPFRIMPLRRSGAFRWAYDCEGRTAGMVIRYPLACAHMDGI